MARAHIEVHGLREARRALRKAGDDIGREMLREANRATGEAVLPYARYNVNSKTGATAASGRASSSLTAVIIRFGGARAPGAGPTHYGTPKGRTRPPRNIKGNPWATDAIAERARHIRRIYAREAQKILDRI